MKKIIALIAVVATMVALLALPVSAAEIFYHDFENPPESGNLRDVGDGTVWKPYSESMAGVVTFEDGAVRIDYASTGRPFWNVHYNVPGQDHVLMYDLMVEMDSPSLTMQLFMGGTRVINKGFAYGMKANTWYTVMIVVTDGATKSNVYYKERDIESETWTKFDVVNTSTNTDGTRGAHTGTDFKLGFDTHSTSTRTGAIWYDNYMVYDGKWFKETEESFDGSSIEEITDIVSGGTFSVDLELYDSNITFNDDMTLADNVTVKTVMVALDKDMKMVGCSTVNIPIKGGLNTVSATLELSDDADAVNYFGNLTDGGQINFYMWNNMQPLCDPIVID